MKKVLALLMVAGMFSLVACGPSEEEKKEAEAAMNEMMEGIDNAMEEVTEEATEATEEVTEEVADTTSGEAVEEGEHNHEEGEDHQPQAAHGERRECLGILCLLFSYFHIFCNCQN